MAEPAALRRGSPARTASTAAAPAVPVAPSGDPILGTRFAVPRLPRTFVRRPGLDRRLTAGLDQPLVLVTGPAGAGKTLLVADWFGRRPVPWPTAWLTAEPDDNAPGMFWAYVLAALRHHGVPLPADIGTPARADEVDRSLLARLAAHLAGRPEPVLLVIDAYDRVPSPQVAAELDFVMHHAGPGLRLVLAGRSEPLLPLHRLRADDAVTDIRGADLAFTPGETAALLRRHGLPRSAGAARALTRRTEGWAAGLRLFALAMSRAPDAADTSDADGGDADARAADVFGADVVAGDVFAGPRTVADFLLAEAAGQPPRTQDLLLRTSILDRIPPDLADALTGRADAARTLAALDRANAFVSPAGRNGYRQHPLLAETLRARLRSRYPGLEPDLHRRAAHWLCDAGLLTDALVHAVAAGDWRFAADRLVDNLAIGRVLTGPDARRLGDLFAPLPAATPGPAADLVRAARALAAYDAERGLGHLRRAQHRMPEAGDAGGSRMRPAGGGGDGEVSAALRLSHAFLRVVAARLLGAPDLAEAAAADAERVAREVPAERLAEHPELPALLLTGLGSARLWAGRLDAAREALTAAAWGSPHSGRPWPGGPAGPRAPVRRPQAPAPEPPDGYGPVGAAGGGVAGEAPVGPAARGSGREAWTGPGEPGTAGGGAAVEAAVGEAPGPEPPNGYDPVGAAEGVGGGPTGPEAQADAQASAGPRREALGALALLDYLGGRLHAAEARAEEALAEAERTGVPPARGGGAAHLVLAAVAVDRDESAAARAALTRAARSPGAQADPVVAAGLAIVRARLRLAHGDPRGCLDAVAEAGARSDGGGTGGVSAEATAGDVPPPAEDRGCVRSPWAVTHLALAASAARLAQGDPDAALAALDGLPPPERAVAEARTRIAVGEYRAALGVLDAADARAGPAVGPDLAVRALLLRAQAAQALGDEAAARRLVARTLDAARPERLRRPFLDAGPWLRPLLRRAPGPARDWLAPGPPEPGPRPGGTAPVPVEPLSAREHDVLEHAAQFMSTQEIAAELFVSVNTVKTHLKSVYRKLGVNRRADAVRRARALRLL